MVSFYYIKLSWKKKNNLKKKNIPKSQKRIILGKKRIIFNLKK